MEFNRIEFFSIALGVNTRVNVILPISGLDDGADGLKHEGSRENPCSVLWLLPSAEGNSDDWMQYTSVARYAEEKNLAVIMPCGRQTYSEKDEDKYQQYLLEELPKFMHATYHLSSDPSRNYLSGYLNSTEDIIHLGRSEHCIFEKFLFICDGALSGEAAEILGELFIAVSGICNPVTFFPSGHVRSYYVVPEHLNGWRLCDRAVKHFIGNKFM